MSAAVAIIAALIQLEPAVQQWINVQQMAKDISDADLQALKDHAHQGVADLGAAIEAAKANG